MDVCRLSIRADALSHRPGDGASSDRLFCIAVTMTESAVSESSVATVVRLYCSSRRAIWASTCSAAAMASSGNVGRPNEMGSNQY